MVNTEKAFSQGIYFHLSHGLRCCHQLTIDVSDAHTVRVNNRQLSDATAYQTLSAPRTYPAHTKNYHSFLGYPFHRLITQQQL